MSVEQVFKEKAEAQIEKADAEIQRLQAEV